MPVIDRSLSDRRYVSDLMANFDPDKNGEVDIWEFKQLWEYIGGDCLLQNEKREIHEWSVTCERYDPEERGGLTQQEMARMVGENGVSASEQVLERLWRGMLASPQVALDRAKIMDFVLKTRNFVQKRGILCPKARNFVSKSDEFCR